MNLVLTFKSWIEAAKTFLKETRTEGKKVVWPSRQYIIAATVIILIIVILTGIFVSFLDVILAKIFGYLMNTH